MENKIKAVEVGSLNFFEATELIEESTFLSRLAKFGQLAIERRGNEVFLKRG